MVHSACAVSYARSAGDASPSPAGGVGPPMITKASSSSGKIAL